jgi:hypothetical protein
MSNDTERSVGSAGSQPVAWAVEFVGEVEPFCLSFAKGKAIDEAGGVGRVVALYRSPTLTDEEREAVEWAINKTAQSYDDAEGGPMKREALRGLLARLT